MTRGWIAAVALVWLAVGAPARAHEIGKTQVTAVFRPNQTYQFDIVVDPDALLTKLQVSAGGCRQALRAASNGIVRSKPSRRCFWSAQT